MVHSNPRPGQHLLSGRTRMRRILTVRMQATLNPERRRKLLLRRRTQQHDLYRHGAKYCNRVARFLLQTCEEQIVAGYWQRSALLEWANRGSFRGVYLTGLLVSLLFVAALSPWDSLAQAEPEADSGPLLVSLFPLTGQRGSTLKVEARGSRLEGVYAVWIDQGGFKGRVLSVEEIKDPVREGANPPKQKKSGPLYRALVELEIQPATRTGVHLLRLVSHGGISNPIALPVVDSPVTVEAAGSHQTVKESQPAALPGFISGRIGEPGEVDYYDFLARKGDRLRFEAVDRQKFDPEATAGKFAPELALYRSGGSWFDPHRPTRLLFEEERSSDLMHVDAEGTYQFSEDGQYFLQVSGLFGQGCPDCTYQVRVVSCDQPAGLTARNEASSREWLERSLSRGLADDWIDKLESRSVKEPEAAPAKAIPSSETRGVPPVAKPEAKQLKPPGPPLAYAEREPNEGASQAASIPVPALIEGTIEHPGDVDSFKFQAEPGQKLAFEVETPEAKPPYFNPRLGVVDSQDHELLSNVERRLSMFNNNADPQVYLKAVRPKAIYSFERRGEYFLQIRDITSRYGNPSYRYRILVRPQIPHVGEISVTARDSAEGNPEGPKPIQISRLNLVRREPKKLILSASYEEGFSGDLSFFFTGLPDGVEPFPAVQFNEGRAPLEVTQNPDAIAPKQQKTAIVLLARPEAPLTTEPRTVQLRCQLITNGKLGPSLLVREIPLMVVEGSAPGEGEKPGK